MTPQHLPFDCLRRICIRAPNWVGDVTMATPAFRAIREHFPSGYLTLVVRQSVEPVVRGAPWFDEMVLYRSEQDLPVPAFLRCVLTLRQDPYDAGFILPNSFSSALMFYAAGVGRRVGYRRDMRGFLLTDALSRPEQDGRFKPTYMVDYYLSLCRQLGIESSRRRMELFFTEQEKGEADAILATRGIEAGARLLLMHPGAGYGPSKRWPARRFARLAEMLHRQCDARVALIAGPRDYRTVAVIQRDATIPIADLTNCGIDLHLLKCVVARSALLVTTDSGPRHYGVALGVPTVCLMGPTHPAYSTSKSPHDHLVRVDVPCGPCQNKVCTRDHRCMRDITPEIAFQTCLTALSGAIEAPGDD